MWCDSNEAGLKEMECGDVDCMCLAEERSVAGSYGHVGNRLVPFKSGNYLIN
jgi:hypothetical protein